MKTASLVIIGTMALIAAPQAPAVDAQSPGILGQEAPSWGVTEWINLPDGRAAVDVTDYRGKVLYLYGFQTWCPGCHSHGFPTLQKLMAHYEDADDVVFVAVQTTFEGFEHNDFRGAVNTAKRYDLSIPVGHSGSEGEMSLLMRRYRTGGTPWIVLIDKQGVVTYNDFSIRVSQAVRLIDRMRLQEYERDDG